MTDHAELNMARDHERTERTVIDWICDADEHLQGRTEHLRTNVTVDRRGKVRILPGVLR